MLCMRAPDSMVSGAAWLDDAAESAAPGELGRDLIAAADIPRSEATRACAATPSMACVAIGDGSSSAASAADSGVDCAFLVARAAANWAFLDACDLLRCDALSGLAAAVFCWPDFGGIGRHGLSRNAAKKFQPRRNHLKVVHQRLCFARSSAPSELQKPPGQA